MPAAWARASSTFRGAWTCPRAASLSSEVAAQANENTMARRDWRKTMSHEKRLLGGGKVDHRFVRLGRQDKDFAVAHAAGASHLDNLAGDFLGPPVVDPQRDFNLGQKCAV